MAQRPDLICLVGPTASGKTALAVELALRYGTEVISADSMQIYRGMDILSAAPTQAEMRGVKHHLLRVCDPKEEFSVSRYVQLALPVVEELRARGKIPLVAGGTGLYVDALVKGSDFTAREGDAALRRQLEEQARQEGPQALWRQLQQVDPERAGQIHPNNTKRVIRALEIYHLTGKTMTQTWKEQSPDRRYRAVRLVLCPRERDVLYQRIDRRVDGMVERGLLDEARRLYERGGLSQTAGQAIGYKELIPYFRGEDTLENCLETVRRESRRYAKRQLTWFRRDQTAHWLFYEKEDGLEKIVQDSTQYLQTLGV